MHSCQITNHNNKLIKTAPRNQWLTTYPHNPAIPRRRAKKKNNTQETPQDKLEKTHRNHDGRRGVMLKESIEGRCQDKPKDKGGRHTKGHLYRDNHHKEQPKK